jgi:hypothetical protein
MLLRKCARTFVSLEHRLIHLEPVDRIAASAQCPKHEILHGMLGAAQ